MAAVSIGKSKPIELIEVQNQKGTNGNWTGPLKSKYTLWAEVEKLSGGRNYQNGQTQLGETFRFKVRNDLVLDFNSKWVLIYNDKELTVRDISQSEEKQFKWIIEASTKHG